MKMNSFMSSVKMAQWLRSSQAINIHQILMRISLFKENHNNHQEDCKASKVLIKEMNKMDSLRLTLTTPLAKLSKIKAKLNKLKPF